MKNNIASQDNDDRSRALKALNGAAVDVEAAAKRLNMAKSELGTAQREHDKVIGTYDSARRRLLKLVPEPPAYDAPHDIPDLAARARAEPDPLNPNIVGNDG